MDASSSSSSSSSSSPSGGAWCGPQGWGPMADDQFSFTPCFQNTFLFAMPALIASFSFISRYSFLSRHHGLGHARSPFLFWPNQIAMTAAVVLVLGHAIHAWSQHTGSSILAVFTMAASWILAIILNNKESVYKIRASSSIMLYTLWTIITIVPNIISLRGDKNPQSLSTYRFYVSYLASISIAFVVQLWPRSSIHDDPEATLYDQANVLSRWTFQYIQVIISRGYKSPLTEDDIQDVMPKDLNTLEGPYQTLSTAWNLHLKQIESYNKAQERLSNGSTQKTKKREPSLLWVVLKAFKAPIMLATFLNLAQTLAQFLLPFFLQKLLRYLDTDEPSSQSEGVMLAIALFAATLLVAILIGQFYLVDQDTSLKIRSAMISLIYRKAMILSPGARKGSTTGEITNHMSTDAQRWLYDLLWIVLSVSVPIHIIVAMVMLYSVLGWSVLMAVAVVIIVLPLQAKAGAYLDTVEEAKMGAQDRRVRLMSEILANIKIIKLYSYDVAFKNRVKDIRQEELENVKKFGMVMTFLTIVFTSLPVFMLMLTFVVYATIGGPDFTPGLINAEKVFVSITLFALLNQPIGDISQIIECLIGLRVANRRIQTFLLKEEMDPLAVQRIAHLPHDPRTPVIQFSDATLAWGPEKEKEETTPEEESETTALLSAEHVKKASLPTLFDINVSIERSSLTAVVGRVGQGKSSLLSALIGDMYKRSGSVRLFGSIAYVPQQAWIVNATVRDNILFGKPFDQKRYDQILHAAGLLPDLEILAAGDATEIGERGINLSGGQKQRISLARAAYQDADVYLLDDPLSAVDAHVDQHLWQNLIGPEGLLKDKTRVLVTHGIHHLDQVDSILVFKDGRVTETGHFKELMKAKSAFYQLINEYSARSGKGTKHKKAKKVAADAAAASTPSSIAPSDEEGDTETIGSGSDGNDKGKKDGDDNGDDDGDLIEDETVQEEAVGISTFMHYVRAMSFTYFGMLVGVYLLWEMCQLSVPIWMQHWTSVVETTDKPVAYYLAVYAGLVFAYMICDVYLTYICFVLACPRASLVLHEQILERVIRLPMSFFDTTPQGRILNRFSSDMAEIDVHVSNGIIAVLQCILNMVGALIVVAVATPMIMFAIPPMALLYWLVQEYYIKTSTVLKRLESKAKSPIYQHFTESLHGCSSIRAMQLQDRFITENAHKVDQHSKMFYSTYMTNRWLNLRLQSLCAVIVLCSALLAVFNRDSMSPSMAGLALSFTLTISDNVVWSLRLYCRLVGSLVSVERVHEYSLKNTEAPLTTGVRLPESWPQHGQITFQNYSARYREGLDLVLKDVSFDVQPGAKIGVVGRTGAGKSSLTLALFRIIEAADSYWAKSSDNSSNELPIGEVLSSPVNGNGGSILIDGIDISTLGLAVLRQHLSIIPQDPTLFAGSVRKNLDPFDEHADQELWTALERAHLRDHIRTLEGGLSFEVSQGGENFSVGQRSLICLARALLRKTKILILDEATAAVDVETDELIQTTIRKEFKDRTILTIAHRIKTVMDSDMILVMEKGQVSEYDSPKALLKRKEKSLFYQLAEQAGEIHH